MFLETVDIVDAANGGWQVVPTGVVQTEKRHGYEERKWIEVHVESCKCFYVL